MCLSRSAHHSLSKLTISFVRICLVHLTSNTEKVDSGLTNAAQRTYDAVSKLDSVPVNQGQPGSGGGGWEERKAGGTMGDFLCQKPVGCFFSRGRFDSHFILSAVPAGQCARRGRWREAIGEQPPCANMTK